MYISQATALSIVTEIGNEIHEQINMMDDNGIIIASTDANRIGMTHEGAKRIIDEKLDQLYITKEMETATVKMGINLSVTVNAEIVGVIGITGDKKRVMKFGNIVRHMTEIMLEDSLAKDERKYDRRVHYRFLESWVKDDGLAINPQFIERGKKLNIDIQIPRRVVIFRINNFLELSTQLEGQMKMESIETRIRHQIAAIPNALFLREPTRQICFLPACNDKRMKEFAVRIRDSIQSGFHEELLAGIDGHSQGEIMVHGLCEEAGKALDNSAAGEKWLTFFSELDVELFLNDISIQTKEEYINKLFRNISEEELEYDMNLMSVYFQCDGSITHAAEKLYIHKNTLQYKLKKIENITGYDIRHPAGTSVLYMALVFYRSLHGKSYIERV